MLEVYTRIISTLLAGTISFFVVRALYPKFKKKEIDDEEKACQYKHVQINKFLGRFFLATSIFMLIVGFVILIFPSLIIEILEFNYLTTALVWWISTIFVNACTFLMLTKAQYNDEEIIVTKFLLKSKTYKFDEIISYSKEGNLRVKTKNGRFTLFRAMSGTESLRNEIKKKKGSA